MMEIVLVYLELYGNIAITCTSNLSFMTPINKLESYCCVLMQTYIASI